MYIYIIVFWKGIIKHNNNNKKERAKRASQSEFTWDHASRFEHLLGRKVSCEHLRASRNSIEFQVWPKSRPYFRGDGR